jgi:hypothetical protein
MRDKSAGQKRVFGAQNLFTCLTKKREDGK